MKQQDKQILIYGGIAALAYFGIINPILKGLGIKKTQAEIKKEKQDKEFVEDQIKESIKVQKPTKTNAEWSIIADQIYNDLRFSAFDDNKTDAAYQVARVKNETDLWILYKYFDKRQEYLFGIPAGAKMNLQQFIISNLSKSTILKINDNYRRKNIKFSF